MEGEEMIRNWENQMKEVPISKSQLNRLVMNYLVVEGYKDAAENFMKESGETPTIDLAAVENRMKIREAIQNGDIVPAIEMANDLDPEILDTDYRLFFHLNLQQLIELLRQNNIEGALQFAQTELAPTCTEHPELFDEMEQVMSLFALKDAESSPVKHLLQTSHRQKAASELNTAILASQAQDQDPKLPALVQLFRWASMKLVDLPHRSPQMTQDGKLHSSDGQVKDEVSPMET